MTKRSSAPPPSSGREPRLAFALMLIAIGAALWPLLSGAAEPVWDARDFVYPSFVYVSDALGEGRLPLWDPYTSCGYPFHADPSNAAMSPLVAMVGLLARGAPWGFVAYWVLFWAAAAVGMWLWARSFGATPSGALVAGLSYAFCGFFVGNAEHTSFVMLGAYLPFIFWTAERAVANDSRGHMFLCGALLGLCSFGGYPAMLFFAGFLLAAWLVMRVLAGSLGDPAVAKAIRLRRVALTLTIAAAILIIVALPSLFAFFREGQGYTDRTGMLSYELVNFNNALTVQSLFSLFYPGASIVAAPALETDVSMANAYVGAVALPLAVLWLIGERADGRRIWWFVVFVGVAFLTSLGGKAYVRILFYYLLPPTRFMRHSGALRVFWMLPLALAAGLGLSALATRGSLRATAWRYLAIWTVGAIVAAFCLSDFLGRHALQAPNASLFLVPALSIAVATIAAWLARGSRQWPIHVMAAMIAIDMSAHVRSNALTVWRPMASVQQVEAMHQRRTSGISAPSPRLAPLAFGYFNAQQIVKRPIVLGYTPMTSQEFDDTLARSRFLEVLRASARAWLSPGAEPIGARATALQTLAATGAGDPMPAFVEGSPKRPLATRARIGSYGRVAITSYAPERVQMDVVVEDSEPALLVTTERAAASWRVSIDTAPAEVVTTNLFFRGVWVPPGTHTVVWTYEPIAFVILSATALVVLFTVLASGAWLVRRSRKEEATS
jgi:hypothetical protein